MIVQKLIREGFKPYRTKDGIKFTEESEGRMLDFSSLRESGLDIRLIKDDIQIVYGLRECDRPPTLIYPELSYDQRIIERILALGDDITYDLIMWRITVSKTYKHNIV